MIADLKPYSEYKDTDLPWLGQVPEHWDIKRLGALLRERGEKNDRGQVSDVLSLMRERGVIPYGEKGRVGNKKSENITRYKIVRPDDVVVNCMNVIIGSVGISRYTGCLSPVYYVLTRRFEEDNPNYLNAYFQTKSFQLSLIRIGNGILAHRMRIPMELLKCELFPRPPAVEQAAIVRFLDHATLRLDKAIRAKRKTIALLNEQKQAIIHRAVTRGLNPDVPLKDSGIPWLGQIPAHWGITRVKKGITTVEQGWSPQCDNQPAGIDEWGVLKVGCVNKDFFNDGQNKKLPPSLHPEPSLEIRDGDILVSRANTRELLGLAALAENPRPRLLLCDKLFRFRARPDSFIPRYLIHALRSKPSRAQIESSTNGASSSMQNIGQGVLKNLWIAMPPTEEQQRIVDAILEDTVDLEVAANRIEREIELLREYRTRLIADVVTGKLDVRDAAARLPQVEDAPADEIELAEIEGAGEELAEEDA